MYKTILLVFASCVAIQTIADLTAEQRASIDASADRALLKDASEEGTAAYWLFRTGPAKIRQISCAMNADDYMLAKQLRNEVDEFFRINRGHIESNFVGYRAAGPVSKAIYSFAEAGLDGTLWSDTTTGPRVIIYQGDNIPIALSYNDFKSGRT